MSDKQGAPTLPPLGGGGGNDGESKAGAPQQQPPVSVQQVLISTVSGQQFVIAPQSLAQVLPTTSGTTTQPISVTRIVNLAGTSPRLGVVNVAGSTTSPSRQNPKFVLTTSPKLVRTPLPNMIVTPTSQTSPSQSPPPKKKLRLDEAGSEKSTDTPDPMGYRRRIIEHKLRKMLAIRDQYNEDSSELFFLQNGGNLTEYYVWKKRPPSAQYLQFMKEHRLETDTDEEEFQSLTSDSVTSPSVTVTTSGDTTTSTSSPSTSVSQSTEVDVTASAPVAVSTTPPPAVAEPTEEGELLKDIVKTEPVSADDPVADTEPVTNPVEMPVTPPISSAQPVVKLVKLSASSIASSCDTSSNSQEQIVEKAKQEAYVMQRVAELQREGLWSERRLPKVQEPPRPKAHWDYLLEEMVWLSADFAQERKWKKAAAKRCARMVQKHFQEKAIQAQKAEKLEELRLKKIASFMAKEIKTFWSNVEKLVEFKQTTRLEEKRKKALDQHLNFIVNQTEKYSTWVTEGLNKPEGNVSTPASIHSSRISSPIPTERHSDDDFKPNQCSDDDEETIAKAEEEMASNHKEEVELLRKESELPLEDLLKELPPNYLEEREKSLPSSPREVVEKEADDSADAKDTEFTLGSDASSGDEEDTIQEQEKLEKNVDHKQELEELEAENEMSIDELRAKYANMPETPMDVDDDQSESDEAEDEDVEVEDEDESETEHESESEDETQDGSQTQSDEEPAVGLKSLLEDLSDENQSSRSASDKQTEMDSVAAIAESIQPKGNTLLTTSVVTKIPFLLKHSLREYQHIGLDWLVTMYERKLNGILADEMGLGKTIQTIALLAHLACEKGNWGPHLIVVPTSVMLNWEMECKKWCPGFKILTYYGSQKDRKLKRTGWTKPNAFHICITSYKLVIQDHASFRRKKWKYLILDEAQNIKNFKSQRWQLLLNFQTQRRLLLTGTPLQNNLMELWSLMHFLMPNVFQSHREFKEWFSNPVTGMIEGNSEYNENIIRRLHKVLRPFLLRRLKSEVEKQMPKKYEHVVMCRLSKRQRYLYDDFMSRAKTKETLATGNLLSVINVLMQLRKVCNHPNLFEVRPTVSPFQMEGINFHTASLAWSALDYDPFKHIDLSCLNLQLIDLEFVLTAFVAHRMRKLQTPRKLIEEIDSQPEPPPRCPSGKVKINVRLSNQVSKSASNLQQSSQGSQQIRLKSFPGIPPTPRVGTASLIKATTSQPQIGQSVTLKVANGQPLQGFSLQLVTHQSGVKAIPVSTGSQNVQSTAAVTPTTTGKNDESVPKNPPPSFAQLVQTSTGRHHIILANQGNSNSVSFPVITSAGQRLTVLKPKQMVNFSSPGSVNKGIGGVVTTSAGGVSNRPVMRVPPLNVSTSQSSGQQTQPPAQIRCDVVRSAQKSTEKTQVVETPKSEFHMPALEEARRQRRLAKLATLANINERRCTACPVFGEDVFETLQIKKPSSKYSWHSGWLSCASINETMRTRRQYFSRTNALKNAIKPVEQIVEELSPVFDRYVVYVPAAQAPMPRFHVSHPAPSKLWADQRLELELQQHLSPKIAQFHPVTRNMMTQFPEPRLIQYDCGKLQSLDRLLRNLKSGNHRVLIFTQMTRMLDVLEAFLNYHGYIYLRLDGATRIDQRQVLMERFNNDKRIFCFILSTRSGGVGVNLTGADTVVFYDSDWNPTMDAQAQDRCHRIGQTRDVHIYRLISERTVEENILKKANQKRLLGDLAIEGGNFTTAYFKSSTIQDLFDVDQTETDASARMAQILDQSKDREKLLQKDLSQPEERVAIGALENAFAAVEEDLDIQAAKTAKAEAAADLAEFDEDIPVEDAENDEQVSKAELEVRNVVSQLTPVERYAMRFVEDSDGNFSAAQLAAAERELEEQKKEWELDRLRAMREEEERQARLTDDDDNPITFTREDSQNQVNSSFSNPRIRNRRRGRPAKVQHARGRGRPPNSRRGPGRPKKSVVLSRTSDSNKQDEDGQAATSDSESETTSLSETDSQDEDVTADYSSDGEQRRSSRTDSADEGADTSNERERIKKHIALKSNLVVKLENHLDLNSPRTRSSGNVQINLWTLDKNPILPESKPRNKGSRSRNNASLDNSADTVIISSQETTSIASMDSTDNKLSDTSMDVAVNDGSQIKKDEDPNESTPDDSRGVKTRRVTTRTRFSEAESGPVKPLISESPAVQETKALDVDVGNASNSSTPLVYNRPGRPRRYGSPATRPLVSSEANLSPQVLLEKTPIDEMMTRCKEESKICDINDAVCKDRERKSQKAAPSSSKVKEKVIPDSESMEKPATPHEQECAPKPVEPIPTEINCPHSPILAPRRTKILRSSARNQTEVKEDVVSILDNADPVTVSMDIDEPENIKMDTSLQFKVDSPRRSSPILSMKHPKGTGSTALSSKSVPDKTKVMSDPTSVYVQLESLVPEDIEKISAGIKINSSTKTQESDAKKLKDINVEAASSSPKTDFSSGEKGSKIQNAIKEDQQLSVKIIRSSALESRPEIKDASRARVSSPKLTRSKDQVTNQDESKIVVSTPKPSKTREQATNLEKPTADTSIIKSTRSKEQATNPEKLNADISITKSTRSKEQATNPEKQTTDTSITKSTRSKEQLVSQEESRASVVNQKSSKIKDHSINLDKSKSDIVSSKSTRSKEQAKSQEDSKARSSSPKVSETKDASSDRPNVDVPNLKLTRSKDLTNDSKVAIPSPKLTKMQEKVSKSDKPTAVVPSPKLTRSKELALSQENSKAQISSSKLGNLKEPTLNSDESIVDTASTKSTRTKEQNQSQVDTKCDALTPKLTKPEDLTLDSNTPTIDTSNPKSTKPKERAINQGDSKDTPTPKFSKVKEPTSSSNKLQLDPPTHRLTRSKDQAMSHDESKVHTIAPKVAKAKDKMANVERPVNATSPKLVKPKEPLISQEKSRVGTSVSKRSRTNEPTTKSEGSRVHTKLTPSREQSSKTEKSDAEMKMISKQEIVPSSGLAETEESETVPCSKSHRTKDDDTVSVESRTKEEPVKVQDESVVHNLDLPSKLEEQVAQQEKSSSSTKSIETKERILPEHPIVVVNSPISQVTDQENQNVEHAQPVVDVVTEQAKSMTRESTESEKLLDETALLEKLHAEMLVQQMSEDSDSDRPVKSPTLVDYAREETVPMSQVPEPQTNVEIIASYDQAQPVKPIGISDSPSNGPTRTAKSNALMPSPSSKRLPVVGRPSIRRRPDTPMPSHPAVRPTTRSIKYVGPSGSNSSDGETAPPANSSQARAVPRSPRTTMDNGFVIPSSPPIGIRRSRSTTYIRMADRLGRGGSIPMAYVRGQVRRPGVPPNGSPINRAFIKKRPDTPMPTVEQIAKSLKPHMPSPRLLPPIPKIKNSRQSLSPAEKEASRSPSEPLKQPVVPDLNSAGADSNGNSAESNLSLSSPEKPQRTAKVVAILSLESKQSGKTNSQSPPRLGSPQKSKLTHSESPGGNCKVSPAAIKSVPCNETPNATTINTNDINSSSLAGANAIDAFEDNKPSERVSRRGKRTRSSMGGKLVNNCNDSWTDADAPSNKLEGDEGKVVPNKKPNRCSSPPPRLSPPDQMNNNPVS